MGSFPFMLLPFRGSHAPQIESVPADADLVTITIGGNDLRYTLSTFKVVFGARVESYSRFLGSRLRRITLPTEAEYEKTTEALIKVVEAIRATAPKAQVMLVDYTRMFGDDSKPDASLPITQAEIDQLRAMGDKLEQVTADAAKRSGATLIEASKVTAKHALGSTDPWVNGAQGNDDGMAFHPRAAAHQAIADEIYRVLQL